MSIKGYSQPQTPRSKITVILSFLVIAAIFLVVYLNQYTLVINDVIEDEVISMKVPAAFSVNDDGTYVNKGTDMYLDWFFMDKNLGLTLDEMSIASKAFYFPKDDVISTLPLTIDGKEARQVQYKTLQTGKDNIHYYYSGLMTICELDNEFLLINIYYAVNESVGLENDIKDSQLNLIKVILGTVKISEQQNSSVSEQSQEIEYTLDKIKIALTDKWNNTIEGGEYGENNYCKFAYFQSKNLPMWIDFYVYKEEYKNDMSNMNDLSYNDLYDFIKEGTLWNEDCMIFEFNDYNQQNGIYYSGVTAISEHYVINMYLYTYDMSYRISEATKDYMTNYIIDIAN